MRGLILAGILAGGTANADIIVQFSEGAPKDRFTITNTADCATGLVEITLDLTATSAGLIFDVTGSGAGVEVFQPFELTSGGDLVEQVSEVMDDDQTLVLTLSNLTPNDQVSFTIDLDDTAGARAITVNGSEIAGAMVRVSSDTALAEGAFDETAQARIAVLSCAA